MVKHLKPGNSCPSQRFGMGEQKRRKRKKIASKRQENYTIKFELVNKKSEMKNEKRKVKMIDKIFVNHVFHFSILASQFSISSGHQFVNLLDLRPQFSLRL